MQVYPESNDGGTMAFRLGKVYDFDRKQKYHSFTGFMVVKCLMSVNSPIEYTIFILSNILNICSSSICVPELWSLHVWDSLNSSL